MNISGRFTTASSPDALAGLATGPDSLESVSSLENVGIDEAGDIVATFKPLTALGRFVLRVTISTLARDRDGARLRVVAARGGNAVVVDLALVFRPDGQSSTAVTWDGDISVHGTMASVGQRVARDIAQQVITDVLTEAASVAKERA